LEVLEAVQSEQTGSEEADIGKYDDTDLHARKRIAV